MEVKSSSQKKYFSHESNSPSCVAGASQAALTIILGLPKEDLPTLCLHLVAPQQDLLSHFEIHARVANDVFFEVPLSCESPQKLN